MRLNRKWLYLGGLAAILTLLLTLTWVLPAGAVGRLDSGTLTTDKAYVSPTLEDSSSEDVPNLDDSLGARTVKVTLTNPDLTSMDTVDGPSKTAQVVLTVADNNSLVPTTTPLLIVDLNAVTASSDNAPDGVLSVTPLTAEHLPVLDNLKVVGEFGTPAGFTASDLGAPRVRNATDSVIEIPILGTVPGNAKIKLSYRTSKEETALLNVRGDSANFDILAIESDVTSQGDYSTTFVVEDSLTMNPDDGVYHEQHTIPSSKLGYVKEDSELIKNIKGGWNAGTGTLTAAAASSGQYWVKVKNPPIREIISITKEDGTAYSVSNDVEDSEDQRQSGIIHITSSDAPGNSVRVSYIGSQTFPIKLHHGPMQRGTSPSSLPNIVNAPSPDFADNEMQVILPELEKDKRFSLDVNPNNENVTDYIKLVSIEDAPDGTCDVCYLTFGVVTGSATKENEPLPARFSVMGISYRGSERVSVAAGARLYDPDDYDDQTGTTDDNAIALVQKRLDYAPTGEVTVVTGSVKAPTATGTDVQVTQVTEAGETDLTSAGITGKVRDGRLVWFKLNGNLAEDANLTSATFDVTYERAVGADPKNALLPGESVRPVIVVSNGSRARITSANNTAVVDAETAGPSYSSVMPAHKGATPPSSVMLSVDVTDSLSGVDKKTIKFKVASDTTYNVANSDLTITDIDNGYRASIALNKVRSDGSGTSYLTVTPGSETTINWNVSAVDKAGNASTSDSVAGNTDDNDDPILDDYTFKVDGLPPVMERAYTGDWFNPAAGSDGRVEGDRLISRDTYLPGSAKNTSIRVVFKEAIDGATVSADDFTVGGAVPSAAMHYSKGSTDGVRDGDAEADPNDAGIARSVFLTVPAMATNATPSVALVGSISDLAGNVLSSGTKTASDGLAPEATVTVDKSLSTKTVNVTVTTDEEIRLQAPELNLYVSDALQRNVASLDEVDRFEIGRQDTTLDYDKDTNPLVIRDPNGKIVSKGSILEGGTLDVSVTRPPIMDRTGGLRGDGAVVDHNDFDVVMKRKNPADANTGTQKAVSRNADSLVSPKTGALKLILKAGVTDDNTANDLKDGDAFEIHYRGRGPDKANGLTGVPGNFRGVASATAANTWTYKVDVTSNGKYAATAVMEDHERNQGTGGIGDPRANGAITFEIDSELAGDTDSDASDTTPDHDPSGSSPVGIADPYYIELSWPKEANEYVGDSNAAVTLTKAELDGTDVLANAVAQDSHTYRIRIDGISLGEHTLVYNGQDAAGNTNTNDRELKFTVKEQPTWNLPLKAEMNLISFPSNPKDTDVAAVFGDTSQVELVFTFDQGRALVAVRTPDGGFAGTLKMLDARRAYWVRATNAVTVEVDIPPTSQSTVLPSIAVKGGEWNLVPVLSLGSISDDTAGKGAKHGTLIDADAYLGDFQIAFGWDTGSWERIDPDAATDAKDNDITDDDDVPGEAGEEAGQDPLKVGKGYWVLYTKDAYIVPR